MRESGEDYLETIYLLNKRMGEVHAVDVAAELGYSKPSITRATGLLKKSGYIFIDDNAHIKLTEKGLKKAEEIYERHQIITTFWVMCGVPEDIAARDACRMEHHISGETFDAIKKKVGR